MPLVTVLAAGNAVDSLQEPGPTATQGQGQTASSHCGAASRWRQDRVVSHNVPDFLFGQLACDATHGRMPSRPLLECDDLIEQVDSTLAGKIRCFDIAPRTIGSVARGAYSHDSWTVSLSPGLPALHRPAQRNHPRNQRLPRDFAVGHDDMPLALFGGQVKQRPPKFDDDTLAKKLKGGSQPTRVLALNAGAAGAIRLLFRDRSIVLDANMDLN